MKNLNDLQKDLGEQIEELKKVNLVNMKGAERELIFAKCDSMAKLAKQMINNADIILRADKLGSDKAKINSIVGK